MSETLNKKFSGAYGRIEYTSGSKYLQFLFAVDPSGQVITSGNYSVTDVKSGSAKAGMLRLANGTLQSANNLLEEYNKQMSEADAVLANPNSTEREKNSATRRKEQLKLDIEDAKKEVTGAQSVISYLNSGFQSEADSIASKAEAALEPPAPPPEENTTEANPEPENKPEEPPAETTSDTAQNGADDDATPPASASENQGSGVVATPGQETTASNTGQETGTSASPGPTGTAGKAAKPGRRLYNPLAQLASYTYSISLYMVTPDAYDVFVQNGRRKLETSPGVLLIAQSGGINNETQNRAPGFELDYYIDNLKFITTTGTKSSGTEVNYTDISFQITEPYGFSFIQNLRKALDELKEHTSQTTYKNCINALQNFYIIGLRFYGYDINGNVIKGTDELYGRQIDPLSKGTALFEHFYDININDLKFNLNGKTVVYNITASGTNGQAILGVKRGRIPEGVVVEGKTVHEALVGPNGLFTTLNKREQDKVEKKNAEFPNIWKVKYLGDAYERIGVASIVTPDDIDKTKWPGSPAKTTTESTDAAGKAPPTNDKRQITFNNDSSIIQVISQVIKQSEYMVNALKTLYNNAKQPDPKAKNQEQTENNIPTKIAWFNVSVEVREPKWDTKLNDWAYTTYVIIQVYEIPDLQSPYSKAGARYYGPHKRYDYWYTGQNSEVLDFSLQFDALYHNVGLGLGQGANASPSGSAGGLGLIPVKTGVRADGDKQGKINTGSEAQNTVTTYLFDAEAWANAKMKILGDPDFLVNDGGTSVNDLYNQFYGTDGYTVSAMGGQVFIEVDFKEAVDYKNSTGLMNINESVVMQKYPKSIEKIAKGAIFMVSNVTSTFSSGKFEQNFGLVVPTFSPDPPDEQSAASDTRESQAQQSAGSTTGSGSAPTSTGATSGTTGQKQDPPPLTAEKAASSAAPAVTAPTTQTTGTSSPQTVTTPSGPVADDDALQEVVVTGTKKATPVEGRDPAGNNTDLSALSDAELFALGYMPDEIANIRNGRG